ncbi:hypothetical protein [Streptomyces sp. V1I1]|uniref:hypothetical protein n=1 Tax=Streptomyces sp. V1I1 TaxID=3042272 RepID=UPI00278B3805|nr:hypothetical protein [Streptomyces sp. V1I1]MDQ0945241.1 hypothetical protein [Streptomyces sp. V1I1]
MAGQPAFLETRAERIRVVNVVPISEAERADSPAARPEAFFSDLLDSRDALTPPALA